MLINSCQRKRHHNTNTVIYLSSVVCSCSDSGAANFVWELQCSQIDLIPSSCWIHIDVSLSKTLNPLLLLMKVVYCTEASLPLLSLCEWVNVTHIVNGKSVRLYSAFYPKRFT